MHRTSRRSQSKLAALAGVAVMAMAVGPAVGTATAAKAKTTTIKPKTLVVKVDPALIAAVETQGISIGPVAPATGSGASGIKLKTKGSITVANKKAKKFKLAISGGLQLDATAILGQAIDITNLSVAVNGAKGTVTADVTLLGEGKVVLEIQGAKLSGKKITGKLVFAAAVGDVLGKLIPEAATGKSFGTFSIS